ncbi:MAG: hypothetical protein R2795_03025 [Saprospiraceae bacterium]
MIAANRPSDRLFYRYPYQDQSSTNGYTATQTVLGSVGWSNTTYMVVFRQPCMCRQLLPPSSLQNTQARIRRTAGIYPPVPTQIVPVFQLTAIAPM